MKLAESIALGKTGIVVSRVGFGVHPLGPTRKNLSVEAGAVLMGYAYEKGIRFFDTAQFYQTYHYLHAGLKRIRQLPCYCEAPVICSKSLACDYDEMMLAIEEACAKLELPQLDIFLLHQVTDDWEKTRAGAKQALLDAKHIGLVRAIGISTHHQNVVAKAAEDADIDVVFALYNYAGLGIRNGDSAGSAPAMLDALRKCKLQGKGVFTMKVFGGGNLTDAFQKAAKHVFENCKDTIASAVIGFTAPEEIDDLLKLLEGTMDPQYNPVVDGKKLHVDREDCMGCGSCVRICASGAMHYSSIDGLAEIDYEKCVGCNYCAIACPERAIVLW